RWFRKSLALHAQMPQSKLIWSQFGAVIAAARAGKRAWASEMLKRARREADPVSAAERCWTQLAAYALSARADELDASCRSRFHIVPGPGLLRNPPLPPASYLRYRGFMMLGDIGDYP